MNRYRQGYLAELELVRMLKARKEFHTLLRSVGSRSSFDVVAIGQRSILLCQVKTGAGSARAEIEKLKSLKVPSYVTKQLRIYRDRSWIIITVE